MIQDSATAEMAKASSLLSLEAAQASFLQLIDSVQPSAWAPFLAWINDSFAVGGSGQQMKAEGGDTGCCTDADATIRSIAAQLRAKLPVNAILDTERTLWPEYGLDDDCKPETTVHVDSFLYDEDDVDELVDQGQLSRNYCRMCGSHSTAPLTFISHSMGIDQLRFVFTVLLPPPTLRGKLLLDVGSRLGAVLYAAQLYSPGARQLLGVELNADLCRLQQQIVDEQGMGGVVAVLCDDIRHRAAEVSLADVLVLNNVFQFFLPPQDQRDCWRFLRETVKKGAVLVACPSLKRVTDHLTLDFALDDWVEQVPTEQLAAKYAGTDEELFEDCTKIFLYQVK